MKHNEVKQIKKKLAGKWDEENKVGGQNYWTLSCSAVHLSVSRVGGFRDVSLVESNTGFHILRRGLEKWWCRFYTSTTHVHLIYLKTLLDWNLKQFQSPPLLFPSSGVARRTISGAVQADANLRYFLTLADWSCTTNNLNAEPPLIQHSRSSFPSPCYSFQNNIWSIRIDWSERVQTFENALLILQLGLKATNTICW